MKVKTGAALYLRQLPMPIKRFAFIATLLFAPALRAQTYTPKTIRIEGVSAKDRPEVMKRLDLPEGAPVTKEQIEAGMGRLAETGSYTDLSYRVDSQALVITLKGADNTAQALPVVFSNLVWWTPEELEKLLEARVPLYHGQLPLTGSLTDEVRAALVKLLAEKGIAAARVEVSMASGAQGIANLNMTLAEPRVLVGRVTIIGMAPSAATQIAKVIAQLQRRDFAWQETPKTVAENAIDTLNNAGYLDATAEPPTVSAPHKDGADYLVDVSATVDSGALYKVSSVDVPTISGDAGGVKPADLVKATGIKAGDVAGLMTRQIGAGQAERVLQGKGFLDARVTPEGIKDSSTHTVAYHFSCRPGGVYTVERVDVSGLPADVAARLAKSIDVQPGARADGDVIGKIMQALRTEGLLQKAGIDIRQNREAHTAVFTIRPTGGIRMVSPGS